MTHTYAFALSRRALAREGKLYGRNEAEVVAVDQLLDLTALLLDAYAELVSEPMPQGPQEAAVEAEGGDASGLSVGLAQEQKQREAVRSQRVAGRQAALAAYASSALEQYLQQLAGALAQREGKYLLGGAVSVADIAAFHALGLQLGALPACLDR